MFYLSSINRGTDVGVAVEVGVVAFWQPARARALGAAIAGLAIVTLCGGCLLQNKTPLSKLLTPNQPPVAEAAIEETPKDKDVEKDNSLAAIEDFLARTSQYRAKEDAATNIPASPVLFPNSREKVVAASDTKREVAAPEVATPIDTIASNARITIDPTPQNQPAIPIPAIVAVSIESPDTDKDATKQPEENNATNQAMDVRVDPTRPTFDDLLADLAAQAEEKADFTALWRLRLAQLAAGRDEEARAIDNRLPEHQATLLADLIDTAMAVRDAARNPLLSGETALATVEDLRDTLADRADPSVRSIAFCQKVSAFGVFEEMSSKDFVAGRKIQTIVYSEIRNLRAQRTVDDRFETRLSTRLAIYSDSGEIVWERDEPEIIDRCSRRRTDFFIAQRISLPATLPAGPYVLKVLVEDKLGGRASESTYDFEIYAPIAVATGP